MLFRTIHFGRSSSGESMASGLPATPRAGTIPWTSTEGDGQSSASRTRRSRAQEACGGAF
eukprot:15437686-Alexandrium_andersonii.AAC.1